MAIEKAIKVILAGYLGLLVVLGGGFLILEKMELGFGEKLIGMVESSVEEVEIPVKKTVYPSLLDGMPLEQAEEQILAVVIENFPTSRPQQRGLSQASVVYETLAEGGITRFLALFSYQSLEKVGPVRSARPYLVDFAAEHQAAFLHAGGSPWGLQKIAKFNRVSMRDMDGLYWEEFGKYFRRDPNYSAPHDMFAYLDEVRVLVEKTLEWKPELAGSFFEFEENLQERKLLAEKLRKEKLSLETVEIAETTNLENAKVAVVDVASGKDFEDEQVIQRDGFSREQSRVSQDDEGLAELVEIITFDFSFPNYKVRYEYDPAIQRYVRYQAGEKHLDGGQEITPANILVRFTDYHAYDEEGRLDMTVTGKGEAWLFTQGLKFEGTWEKKEGERTWFLDAEGDPFKLTPGQTWIEVINQPKWVSY